MMPDMWVLHSCETCGAIPIRWTADMSEGDPIVDAKGEKWRTWEYDGAAHFRCADHPYVGKLTYQDGHVDGGYNV